MKWKKIKTNTNFYIRRRFALHVCSPPTLDKNWLSETPKQSSQSSHVRIFDNRSSSVRSRESEEFCDNILFRFHDGRRRHEKVIAVHSTAEYQSIAPWQGFVGAATERGAHGFNKGSSIFPRIILMTRKLIYLCHRSMCKTTKHLTQIGLDWSLIRKAQNGSESAGICTICWNMSLTLSLT